MASVCVVKAPREPGPSSREIRERTERSDKVDEVVVPRGKIQILNLMETRRAVKKKTSLRKILTYLRNHQHQLPTLASLIATLGMCIFCRPIFLSARGSGSEGLPSRRWRTMPGPQALAANMEYGDQEPQRVTRAPQTTVKRKAQAPRGAFVFMCKRTGQFSSQYATDQSHPSPKSLNAPS